jgi:hypothetical protein
MAFYRTNLGFIPEAQLWVTAECKGSMENRILGRLILHLAEQFGGIINLNGAITSPYTGTVVNDEGYRVVNYSWHSLEDVSAFVHTIPGQVFEHFYTTWGGEPWVSHYVDLEFFRAWLEHPHFHLIK